MTVNYNPDNMEAERIAPWGMASSSSKGRIYAQEEHPYRTAFQRDRDRIIHCSAFRRLEYKTQVFVYHEGDYYRTRLTHTIEVAQIARSTTRVLRLNEDLAEAIALAHDLGHPPFGHSGEKLLDELMKQFGGFEHNRQSLRIVDYIETRYPKFRGLNLTYEVREGIAKHITEYDQPTISNLDTSLFPTLEAQIVDYSDGIAYNSHDLDDGITSNLIDIDSLRDVRIWKEIYDEHFDKSQGLPENIIKYQMIRALINMQVTDLVETTANNINSMGIGSVNDVRRSDKKVVEFSPLMQDKDAELKAFLKENMYMHHRVIRMEVKAGRFLRDLFNAYLNNPKLISPNVYKDLTNETHERLICDYIAGMTDRYALEEHKKLFDPYARV